MNLGLPSASPDLDRELLFHACPPSSMGRKEFAYALNCLVADSRCSRRRHLYGSAQSSDPELAGASVPVCRDHCLRLAPRLAWNRSLSGIALGALLLGVFCWMGGMGMGDVKLCAAIGAWIGPAQLVTALVITGIAGGIMAVCWAVRGGFLGDLFKGTGELIFGLKDRGLRPHPELVLNNPLAHKMPYAPAIAIGTLVSFFSR
jgi:prepilin signal peptidase PulO-like enzyme (type II secretory pathway)